MFTKSHPRKRHFHSMGRGISTEWHPSSLSKAGIHVTALFSEVQAPWDSWTSSTKLKLYIWLCFPCYFKYHKNYSQQLLGFPVCKPCLTLGEKKITLISFSSPLPFPSNTSYHIQTWPCIYIYFSNIYTDFLKVRKKFICSNVSKY